MTRASTSLRVLAGAGLLTVALSGLPLLSQQRDAYGAPADAPPPASDAARDEYGDVRQTVARIAVIEGTASYARGDDPENWQPANANVPLTIGDRLYTETRSRAELQVEGGNYARIGSATDLAVLNLTDDTKQFAVKSGVASFQIRSLDENDVFEIDTPNAAITVERPGDYRVDVDANGGTRVSVREGAASVAAGGGSVSLGNGDAMRVIGLDSPQYDVVPVAAADGWDLWVSERQTGLARSPSAQYVNPAVVGVADLDAAGRWDTIPEYGRVWSPSGVAAGWVPYRDGQWIWQDPWGWTWVSTERWGWAPYHYGRWVTWSSRWFWVPVALPVRRVVYAPALVAFVGGGPVTTTVVVGGGYVGWFPLAPRDPFIPWWGRRSPTVSVTQVTYVNRTYVTVVNQTTFVSGAVVANNFVRDRVVLHDIATAPVVRGSLAIVPTRQSLWLAPRPGAVRAVAPPATVVSRSVVARVAPPPAPPSFQQKLTVIKENRGAPIPPNLAAEMSIKDRGSAQAITTVRPVVAEAGRVTLAPARPASGQSSSAAPARVAVPVAPPRGRALATTDHPVSTAPVVAAPVVGARPQTLPASANRQESGPASPPTPIARPTVPARATSVETDESRNRGRERPTPAPQVGSERPPQEQLRAPVGRPTAPRPPTPVPNERVPSPERRQPTPVRAPATPEVNERGRSHERTAERPTPVRPPSPEGNERRGSRESAPAPTSASSGERRATTRPPEPPRGGRGEPQQQEKRPTPTKTPGRPSN